MYQSAGLTGHCRNAFFEVDIGQESTCTKFIRYADSVVYGSVSEGYRLNVYVVVNAEAIWG